MSGLFSVDRPAKEIATTVHLQEAEAVGYGNLPSDSVCGVNCLVFCTVFYCWSSLPADCVLNLDKESLSAKRVLNSREQNVVAGLDQAYVRRTSRLPQKNPNLVYFLGDSLERKAWSAASNKLPTFRRQSGLYLRRLTAHDKLAAQGWPVSDATAQALGTTKFPCLDVKRADSHVCNGMHLMNCATVILLGLSCFGKQERAEPAHCV